MKRGVRFTALIWLMMVIAREVPAVPPPTDVEVICRNLKVQVRWKDSSAEQSSFTVALKGNNGYEKTFPTAERQYDLTRHIWGSEDNYMSTFHVVVTATVGGNRSEPALSQTFTFSSMETAAKTCRLDFPPVELVRNGLDATLSFSNPFHFYGELRQAAKPDTAIFSATITSNDNENKDFLCRVKEETCKYDIVFPEGKEHCVTLDGILVAGNRVGQILFNRTGRICAAENTDTGWIVICVLLAVVTLAVIVTVAIIVAKRSSPKAPLEFPSAIQWPLSKPAPFYKRTSVSGEDTFVVPATPRNTEPSHSSQFSSCQGSRASVCTEHESSDQEQADLEGLSDDGDAECEPMPSGYDRRQCIMDVDMGDGDMATAYRM